MREKRGYFITIEGIEGVGKSTIVQYIASDLHRRDVDLVLTREPGGTPIAEAIRQILLQSYTEEMTADTELLLFFAGRAQHLHTLIKPAIARGQWVISDRFSDASYAYQGAGRGVNVERIEQLENWVLGDLRPDLTLLLDAPVEIALARIKSRDEFDRIEKEQAQFFVKIRQCYLERAKKFAHRYKIINAAQDIKDVQEQVKLAIEHLLSVEE